MNLTAKAVSHERTGRHDGRLIIVGHHGVPSVPSKDTGKSEGR
jgi:hypothetical protein